VVFVRSGPAGSDGFEPRVVRLGSRGDGLVLVLDGVQAGESVAVRANFLLDSESRLRAAVEGLSGEQRQGGGR
jgi:Cu(I)/Ag(I) efflux system membrane fusion protein